MPRYIVLILIKKENSSCKFQISIKSSSLLGRGSNTTSLLNILVQKFGERGVTDHFCGRSRYCFLKYIQDNSEWIPILKAGYQETGQGSRIKISGWYQKVSCKMCLEKNSLINSRAKHFHQNQYHIVQECAFMNI